MLKIGLTGGIGSGKSVVAQIFRIIGIPIYDADIEARHLMQSNAELISAITETFGPDTYLETGKLNRPYLAEQVFQNRSDLNKLNDLVHPAVHEDFRKWAEKQDSAYVIDEAALIFESGGNKHLDQIILVTAPVEVRIQRVIQRNKTTREDVLARIANQWTDEQKIPLSHFVINNDGKHALIKQVLECHQMILDAKEEK